MSGSDPATVKNDVTLDGMLLLTGPNMAGARVVVVV
jgi:DNA mismatch repair ATPase MutS